MAHTSDPSRFLSHRLATWAAGLRYEDLPASTVHAAKRFWLDSLACAIGGSRTHDAQILLDHYRAMSAGSHGPCTTLVSGFHTNPVDAAFLNSHLVRAMDFNDIYWQADPCHPSDLICAPLALCELRNLSGQDLILATAIVYELQCRFAEIGRPGIREYGWHHATLSGFASGLACARVLGLTPSQATHAVGISAARSGTLGAVTAGELTMMKNTVDPWAARLGAESALLAERGFTGPAHIIDGKEGLFHTLALADGTRSFDAHALTADLPTSQSDPWRIERVSMKSFPVEALMHTPLTALMAIRNRTTLDPARVREIRVEVIARAADILGDPAKYRPTTRETADHSLPYAMAVGLVDGQIGPDQFDESRVQDPALHPVMDAVRVVPNTEFESRFPASQPSRVTVTLDTGETYSEHAEYPKGDPRHPMTDAEIESKLRMLCAGTLSEAQADRLIEVVGELEHALSVEPLLRATHSEPEHNHSHADAATVGV